MALLEKQEQEEEAQSPSATLVQDARWKAVERIIASRNFAKSGRLRAFLVYIVQCTMEDRAEEITEQQIGVHVFGRSPSYNPAEDNIVRSTARQLRQRLALYYQEEGTSDTLRVQIPRGGYLPVFQIHPAEPIQEHPVTSIRAIEPPFYSSSQPTRQERLLKFPVRKYVSRVCSFVAVLLLGAALALLTQRTVFAVRPRPSATNPLWCSIFSANQKTLFVPGDAGLNMYNNEARAPRELSLSDYVNGNYLHSATAQSPRFAGTPLAGRGYVTFIDLKLASRFMELARFRPAQYEIKFPRNLTAVDFRNANAILAGAPVYNPWVTLFDHNLNFHIAYNGISNNMYVENLKPRPGEPPIYQAPSVDSAHQGFGYIALTDNLGGNGKVLLIEGTTAVGVDAALSFLFDNTRMAPIIARVRSKSGTLSNFEVLLQARFLRGYSAGTRVLATRFYPHS